MFTHVQFLDCTKPAQDGKFAPDDTSCMAAARKRTNHNAWLAKLFADTQHARVAGSLRFFWLSRGVGGLKLDVSRQKVKAWDKPHASVRVVVVCVEICGPILQESGPHAPQSAHVTALEDGTSETEGQP